MKIRFGANDVIDTKTGGAAPENYEEVENAALNTKAELDDDSTSYEDQTQLNILKRFVKGFLRGIAYDSGRGELESKTPELFNKIYEEFNDIVSSKSDAQGWGAVRDQILYDDKAEDAGE